MTYVSIELPDEAREVVVLEVFREEIPGVDGGIPHDKGRSILVPGDDVVRRMVIDQLVGFR